MSDTEMFIEHIPLCPPRTGIPGEGIYLKLWQEFAEKRPDDWADIFRDMNDGIDQRIASVAASFMVFMGCNAGRNLVERANQLRDKFPWPVEAFEAAWAIMNRRRKGINCGLRVAEYMLATVHPIDAEMGGRVVWERVPDVTQKDMDTLECMVAWWSTRPAERMREIAEAMIVVEQKKLMSALFEPQRAQAA